MRNCNNCFWCRIAFNSKYIYKCKMGQHLLFVGKDSKNYINKPKLHGFRCRYWKEEVNADEGVSN
ncbi:MAG TPA: hypothetical protein DHV37_05960 [Erysipelotrichaceae bacterium]|nr:hypothetical protein [Erysipelotrichaceae bacterium]